jgi:hypothetical protein
MRYKPDEPRLDDPEEVAKHKGRYQGGVALVVLGGYSAAHWQEVRDEIKPDVIIGANGTNGMIRGLDYWLMVENLAYSRRRAAEGDPKYKAIMEMFHRESGAKNKFVAWTSWDYLTDTTNCVRIRWQGRELDEMDDFTFRDYGSGLLAGWEQDKKEYGVAVYIGTVGAQCIHLAGILGVREVHTIGYDLMFREAGRHHAYEYPLYCADKYRTPASFLEYRGVKTQQTWVETAQWWKAIEYQFDKDNLIWRDHSDGLLKLEGLKAANRSRKSSRK